MKRIIWLLGCLVIMSAQAGELYRWVDNSGRVYYGDLPPADAVNVEVMKAARSDVPNEYIPYESRRAQQNFPVTLYVGNGCGETCDQARSLLNKRGVPFSEKFLRTKDEIDTFKRITGSEVVPTLMVGKTILKIFQPEQWHGELDIAGYPKIAPYRAPITKPAPANPAAPELPAAP